MSKSRILRIILITIQVCSISFVLYGSNPAVKNFEPGSSIVQIFVTSQKANYDLPWQMRSPSKSSGSGCVIADNCILTNAHVVADSTFIQVRKAGGVDRYTAEVEYIGHDSDLAVLKVKDESFYKETIPIELGQLSKLRDNITVYAFPKGGSKLFITRGTISRIEKGFYSHGWRHLLSIQIDAVIDNGSSGGPILFKNKIVGLTFQGDNNINSGIPVRVIRHFLKDIEDGKYDGMPSLSISTQSLENPDMRSFLKMKKSMTGVLINRVCFNSSGWDQLRSGDVLMAINSIPVANDSTIGFRNDDRLSFLTEVQKFQIGDHVNVTFLREGKKISKNIFLRKKSYLVPMVQYDKKPTYYTFAGLVFTKLNFDFIMTWDKLNDAPTNLKNYCYNGRLSKKRQEIIILSKILSDDINKGYQGLTNGILKSVNGKFIKSMRDMKSAIENNKNDYLTITLETGKQIVLNYNNAKKVSPDILKQYGITSSSSEDLK